MRLDLEVVGQGAVSPAGMGLDALLHRVPTPLEAAPVARPDHLWPVLRVEQKEAALVRWQREPRLRRASPITYFLVEAANQALAGLSPRDRAETGLIVAYSAGCVAYSRRFFGGIIAQGQKSASPALFPETVFNSPVSHVASVLGLNGAAYAVVGDETAWIAALQTASVWLRQGRVRQAVVLGAEEFDPLVLDAYASARWLRRSPAGPGFLASEGAGGILVRSCAKESESDSALVLTRARDGFIYRSKQEAASAAERLVAACSPALPFYRTAVRNPLAGLEKTAIGHRFIAKSPERNYLGEAFTASAAWRTLWALSALGQTCPGLIMPVWGLNHQLGFVEMETRK